MTLPLGWFLGALIAWHLGDTLLGCGKAGACPAPGGNLLVVLKATIVYNVSPHHN